MADTLRYSLQDFNDIIFNGFNITLPDDTIAIISKLSKEVGSPDYVKTPVFKKRENPMKADTSKDLGFKKKRTTAWGEKSDTSDTSFQATKLETKIGVDAQIDTVRSYLNKMTDKNYGDIKTKIMDVVDKIENEDDMLRVSTIIFEIASNNRFFSKIYADLYSVLIGKYDIMRIVFENSLNKYAELFDKIEYVESTVDYDTFCKNNKDNEKRKALSSFFLNLMINKIISNTKIIEITINLLTQLYAFISQENKKHEVDELTENISILYKKELYNCEHEKIDGMTVPQLINKLAHSKTKDYLSLTNKTIFKFMDVIEM